MNIRSFSLYIFRLRPAAVSAQIALTMTDALIS
jgi:hypothetical protein